MATNGGNYFHPYVTQENSSSERGILQEPLVFNTLNLWKSARTEVGNSFLALLSGPSQQLQCELQQLSNLKNQANVATGKPPVHDNRVAHASFLVMQLPSLSQLQGNQSVGNGPDPVFPARALSTSTGNPISILHNNLQTGSLHIHSTGNANLVLHHAASDCETGKEVPSQSWGWLAGANLMSASQEHTSTLQSLVKMPPEAKSSAPTTASSLTRRHPRVYCLGTGGDLLLSDTGLLGVVCLCHGLHMSVAKFCEHSGSSGVNPGDSVRLESGETIAQWRRIFLFKFGMRIPEDNSGWDWPDGISAPGGFKKCNATMGTNMMKNSGMFQQPQSFGGITTSRNSWNEFVYPNSHYVGQSLLPNSFNKIVHNAQQSGSIDGAGAVKSSIGTSRNILPTLADNPTSLTAKQSATFRDLAGLKSASDKVRINSGHQSVASSCDLGSSLFCHDQSSWNLKNFGSQSDISQCNSTTEAFVMDKDAISSNIELRLGQPSQQGHVLRSSVFSAMQPQLFDTLCASQKSQFNESLVHRAANTRVTKEARQILCFAPSGTSNFNGRDKESQLNLMHPTRSINAVDPSTMKNFKSNGTKSSPISLFLPHSSTLGGNIQSQATNSMTNDGHHVVARVHDADSHTAKCNPSSLLRNIVGGMGSKFDIDGPGLSNHVDTGQGSLAVDNHSCPAAKPSTLFHSKHLGDPGHLAGVSARCTLGGSSVHDWRSSPCLQQSSAMLMDASDAWTTFNHHGKASCIGNSDLVGNVFSRSMNVTPVTAGSISPSSVAAAGFSSVSPVCIPNLTSALPNKKCVDVSPLLLDENLKLLSLRHIVELSKREHSTASLEMDLEEGGLYCHPAIRIQGKGAKEDNVTSRSPYENNKQDIPDVATRQLQSCFTCYPSGECEKLADLACKTIGTSNFCSLPTSVPGISLCSKEFDVRSLPCHDCVTNEQALLRLARAEDNITFTGEHKECRQKESNPFICGKCNCAVQSKCLAGSCISAAQTSIGVSKEYIGNVGGRASAFGASICKDHMDRRVKMISEDHIKTLKRHAPMKNGCHFAQWVDVPSKSKGNRNGSVIEKPAEVSKAKGIVEDQLADTAAKGFNETNQETESFKEQQMSNVYSGCSAPAVTEASVEVNNLDSCAVGSTDCRFMNDFVVDEGSGIETCCSSDNAGSSLRWAETVDIAAKSVCMKDGCVSTLPKSPPCDLIDELKQRNSFKTVKNRSRVGCTVPNHVNDTQQIDMVQKTRKRKKPMKWKKLDASFPNSGLSSVQYDSPSYPRSYLNTCKKLEVPVRANHGMEETCPHSSGPPSFKRKRSALSSDKIPSRKIDIHGCENHHRKPEEDHQTQFSGGDEHCLSKTKLSAAEKRKNNSKKLLVKQRVSPVDTGKCPKLISADSVADFSFASVDYYGKKARPVVCGNSGIISNLNSAEGLAKPVKIVSLRSVLKVAKRCTITENEIEPTQTSVLQTKKARLSINEKCYYGPSFFNKVRYNSRDNILTKSEGDPGISSVLNNKKASLSTEEGCAKEHLSEGEKGTEGDAALKLRIAHGFSSAWLKLGVKGTHKCSLDELTGQRKHAKKSYSGSGPGENRHSQLRKGGFVLNAYCKGASIDALDGKYSSPTKFCPRKQSECALQSIFTSYGTSSLKNADDSQRVPGELHDVSVKRSSIKERKCEAFLLDSDAFCSVCGSSNKDEVNRLLECSHCLIRVHQACYGIAKIPKGRWNCRPCRANSKNVVCVLCGYEGGAMTRALRSQNIVKGLLKARNFVEGSNSKKSVSLSKSVREEFGLLGPSSRGGTSGFEEADSSPVMRPMNTELFSRAALVKDLPSQTDPARNQSSLNCDARVHHTVTARIVDSTVKQWVHMVCGLWTPGTRCPNVDTMSAFDVSGASSARKNMMCSMCNRPGGSCIQCRVLDCSLYFHPWCAHQKGLLQSETEGTDDEKVGFYGKCLLHATHSGCLTHNQQEDGDTKLETPRLKEVSCARTEGFKGCKNGEGFSRKFHMKYKDNSGCLVPQEQINAWLHINAQRSRNHALAKPPALDIEYDCRKEYARYKQAQGWKHLVVYKSGIHALGLYTSQFISRGAMVVEYVGEIVGLRVADKREIEYQSGRKVQYKSACYFFRIDKEHIIDATRKGGIARFVNHSCLPNCVAKVISVRNDKKVVFFAVRDINPGEEITYDYHFNHEDEGKKILCFCNSKNCRRYLN